MTSPLVRLHTVSGQVHEDRQLTFRHRRRDIVDSITSKDYRHLAKRLLSLDHLVECDCKLHCFRIWEEEKVDRARILTC